MGRRVRSIFTLIELLVVVARAIDQSRNMGRVKQPVRRRDYFIG
jgi:hypothetical protein